MTIEQQRKINIQRRYLLKRYNLTLQQYDDMLYHQENKCAICKQTQIRALSVDHCHKSNRIRSLLCTSCNALLGLAHEDINVLEAAIDYLNCMDSTVIKKT